MHKRLTQKCKQKYSVQEKNIQCLKYQEKINLHSYCLLMFGT